MKKLVFYSVYMGCDPEFFFSKNDNIIGAEKLLPKEGLECNLNATKNGKVIIDGVQAELNPIPSTCRESLACRISACFKVIQNQILTCNSSKVDFSQVVEIDKKELLSLSEQSRVFGCEPSQNFYSQKESVIKVKANEYKYRSAGGHIHLGGFYERGVISVQMSNVFKSPQRLVPMLDIILGNTCVLIDKNPLNKERRKVYGKAGEFRIPKWGLEYRTLSNFWLMSYPLMSFVFGMARLAMLIIANSVSSYDNEKIIRDKVDINDIQKAINNNDFELALKNFSKIEDVLVEISEGNYSYPICSSTIKEFKYFITKDLSHWFKDDPLKHWISLTSNPLVGWEQFCSLIIKKEMENETNKSRGQM